MTLLSRDDKSPRVWKGDLPVKSRYSFGIAGEQFFRTIKDKGTFLGSRCEACQRTIVPAALFCERCMGQTSENIDLGTGGTLHAVTLLHRDVKGVRLSEPEIVAFIKIGDGGLIHKLKNIDYGSLEIGMQLEAVFLPKNDRIGSILDIQYFQPVS